MNGWPRRQWIGGLAAGVYSFGAPCEAASPIQVGSSAALSGPAGALGRRYHAGSAAALAALNRAGGVSGRAIHLQGLDDGYEPSRAVKNTETLAANKEVLALLGYVGTPTTMAALPVIRRSGLALVGPYTGADELWERDNPLVFAVRASYRDEAKVLAEAMRTDRRQRLAVLYQADLFGRAGLEAMVAAVKVKGPGVVRSATVKRNSIAVESAVRELLAGSAVDAIFMVSTYETCAAFVQAARAAGFKGGFYTLSFAGLEPLRQALQGRMQHICVSQVVPDPEDARLAVVASYQNAMDAMSDPIRDSISLEGYLSARVLIEALRRARPPLTRRSVVKALEGLARLDLGGFELDYRSGQQRGSKLVRLVRA